MPPQRPSDDPQLPKLRRFRLDSDGSKVAREVSTDAATRREASSKAQPVETPVERVSDAQLVDPDRLLDETVVMPAGPAPESSRHEPTYRSAQRDRRPERPDTRPSDPRTAPVSRPPEAGGPFTGPVIAAGKPQQPNGGTRSKLPLLVGGIAAAVVLGLIAWLVIGSGSKDDPNNKATESNSGGRSGEQSEVTTWADGVCSAVAKFDTEAMPIRAATAQAANAISPEKLNDLQRQGSELLSGLAASLQAVGQPTGDKDVAALHVELLTATNQAASSTNTTSGGSIGSASDRAAALASAIDTPVTLLIEGVNTLPEAIGDEVAAAPACSSLL